MANQDSDVIHIAGTMLALRLHDMLHNQNSREKLKAFHRFLNVHAREGNEEHETIEAESDKILTYLRRVMPYEVQDNECDLRFNIHDETVRIQNASEERDLKYNLHLSASYLYIGVGPLYGTCTSYSHALNEAGALRDYKFSLEGPSTASAFLLQLMEVVLEIVKIAAYNATGAYRQGLQAQVKPLEAIHQYLVLTAPKIKNPA